MQLQTYLDNVDSFEDTLMREVVIFEDYNFIYGRIFIAKLI